MSIGPCGANSAWGDNLKILLTGANGFVGAALLQRLQEDGCDVAVIVRSLVPNWSGAVPTACFLGELGGASNFATAVLGIDTVIHLAARVHVMHEVTEDSLMAFRAVNVDGTLNLARQAAAAGVKRFVFVSSVKVNGECTQTGQAFTESEIPNPQDAYGISKHEAELALRQLAAETDMQVVIIRPPLVYGPGVKANFAALLKVVQRGWPLPLGAVRNQRSLVGLDNLVDFIVTCISHPKAANQIFMVSDGHDLSTAELVHGMSRAARVPARLLPVPVWALQTVAAWLGKGDAVQRLCGNLQVDISKARIILGWTPPFSVDEGLRRTAVVMQKS